MRLENIVVVAKREYLQRVKTKAFWITTLILPLFVTAVSIAAHPAAHRRARPARPSWWWTRPGSVGAGPGGQANAQEAETPKERRRPGRLARRRGRGWRASRSKPSRRPRTARRQRAELDRRVLDEKIDAWVWIGSGVLGDEPVEYHARSVSNVFTQDALRDDLSEVVRRVRLPQAGIDPARVEELTPAVELETSRSRPGSRAERRLGAGLSSPSSSSSSSTSTILMWGQQVMQGVLEEKGSRVIEVLISARHAVRADDGQAPRHLPAGADPARHLARHGGGADRARASWPRWRPAARGSRCRR